jgi:hypothetical protein
LYTYFGCKPAGFGGNCWEEAKFFFLDDLMCLPTATRSGKKTSTPADVCVGQSRLQTWQDGQVCHKNRLDCGQADEYPQDEM